MFLRMLIALGCGLGVSAWAQPPSLAKTPPMGWNSWNRFGREISDSVLRAQADAMVGRGLKGAGYIYLNIDDGWAGERDARGVIHPNRNFPDMKALADYVHAKGLKFGIYTAVTPKTCVGLEGSLGHEEADARTYASWGVDYVKADWCGPEEDSEEIYFARYKKLGDAIVASGRPMIYSISSYGRAWKWAASTGAHLWRTGINIKDNWFRMAAIGFGQNGLERFSGPGHWNDPDMLEVGNDGADDMPEDGAMRNPGGTKRGMSEAEYRTHMSLWCLLSAPLIVGTDLTKISDGALALLTNPEILAVDQDTLGIQGRRVAQEGPLEVWMKPLADGAKAVGLFNRELGTMPVTVHFRDIAVGAAASVRDLWAQKDLGVFQGNFTARVPSHGVVMLKVK